MAKAKKTKWDLTEAIVAGENALELSQKYSDLLGGRITQEGMDVLRTRVNALKEFDVNKEQIREEVKSKTAGKDATLAELNHLLSGIRTLVKKSPTVTAEIKKAFGVGANLSGSRSQYLAAGKLIIEAYKNFTAWSNGVGILEADITAIAALIADFEAKEANKTGAVKARKVATFDKNSLQRQVEDEVSRISALGVIVFGKKEPAVAELFEGLIPSHTPAKEGGTTPATPATT